MVEYLEKLVEDREHEKALSYAEQLMLNTENSLQDLMRINRAILTSRYYLGEFHGAVVAGELATKLSRDLEEWDHFGVSSLDLGAAWNRLRQPEFAIDAWFGYLERLHLYTWAGRHAAMVWYNLGIVYMQKGDTYQTSRSLAKALEAAESLEDERYAHGIRQALIEAYVRSKDLENVPKLLVRCEHFLRHHPNAPRSAESRLWNLKLRSEFALATDRLNRAVAIAQHGLKRAHGMPRHQYQFHMIIADVLRRMGRNADALEHSLSARVYAIRSRRYDLELEAADFMYDMTKADPQAIENLRSRSADDEIQIRHRDLRLM